MKMLSARVSRTVNATLFLAAATFIAACEADNSETDTLTPTEGIVAAMEAVPAQ